MTEIRNEISLLVTISSLSIGVWKRLGAYVFIQSAMTSPLQNNHHITITTETEPPHTKCTPPLPLNEQRLLYGT